MVAILAQERTGKGVGFVSPKCPRPFIRNHPIHISNSQRPDSSKTQSSAAPVLARRGERRAFPSPRSRGESSLTKGEGSGAPKGAGNISNALRRTLNNAERS